MSLARCRYPLRFAFKLMFLFGWKSFKERRACQLIPPEGSIISLSINFGTINLQRDDAKCMATKSERNGIWYEILNVIANPLTSKIRKIYYQVRWDDFKLFAFLEASISQNCWNNLFIRLIFPCKTKRFWIWAQANALSNQKKLVM